MRKSDAELRRLVERLAQLPPEERLRLIRTLTPEDLLRLDAHFESWAHPGQRPPEGDGWRTWLMMAGRGYGKTRAGAEWITQLATQRGRRVRIALVGATIDEVRKVMIEGESGLLAVGRGAMKPVWEPSRGRLRWRGGSEAFVYSGENPEGLRGPAHHFAWCDELAKWSRAEETWDNLQLGLRCGERPRALVTTTPRSIPLLKRIKKERWTAQSGGRTSDNAHLPKEFLRVMVETYGGTRIGRQELDGKMDETVEGSLWPRALIERCRVEAAPALARVVIGVDPPASARGTCGIVAAGVDSAGTGYVVGDHSVRGLSPKAGRGAWRSQPRRMARTGWWSRPTRAARWWRACLGASTRRFR